MQLSDLLDYEEMQNALRSAILDKLVLPDLLDTGGGFTKASEPVSEPEMLERLARDFPGIDPAGVLAVLQVRKLFRKGRPEVYNIEKVGAPGSDGKPMYRFTETYEPE